MGLDSTVDERTRELAEFICTIEAIPGGTYDSATEMIHNLSTNCKEYNRAKKKIVACLFAALEYNPTLRYLAKYLDGPDTPGTQV